ncbi:MAG: DNA polymerase I [Patescibacteria group bacterium]
MKKLLLIDSNALIHRAYHALPPLATKDGTLTNAVYGYAATLISAVENIKPDYAAAAFDLPEPTFRHKKYDQYKATREKAPDELYAQIPLAKEFLNAYNIPVFEQKGYEADDLIGTLSGKVQKKDGIEIYILTGDLDTLQLVDDHIKVMTLRKGINDSVIYDKQKVEERFGLKPNQMVDYKALRGDPSDNIPGVKGVGEKTATELLLKYKTLEEVYSNIEKITSKSVKEKLKKGRESAFMSKDLAEIERNVPVDFDLEKCTLQNYNAETLKRYMLKMEFSSLLKRISSQGEDPEIKFKEVEKIEDPSHFQKIASKIKKEQSLALEAHQFEQNTLAGMGLYLPGEKNGSFFYVSKNLFGELKELLTDKQVFKIGYDLKRLSEVFFEKGGHQEETGGQSFVENFFDVKIAAYLLRSGSNNDLDKLVLEEFGASLQNQTTRKGQAGLWSDSLESEIKEIAERAGWSFKLYENYKKSLREIAQEQRKSIDLRGDLEKLIYQVEFPLIKVLAKMESEGVAVDKTKLEEASRKAQEKISALEKEIFDIAGEEFNINSPAQLAKILYGKLNISTREVKRGKTGYSTDADQLRKIRHLSPIIPKIENYREFFKLKTTYADALPELVRNDRIHTNYNQTVTATGRLSSSNPNLQNIPKKGEFAKLIRSSFIAGKGRRLVAIDYSQIDLRVAAHVSGDEKLIEIFRNNKDVHRATAAWVNGISEEEVSDAQRSEAKSLNFGILYGMGVYGFMRDSGLDREKAEFFIDQYMKSFAGLKKYLEKTKQIAQEKGYVETELGRRRYISNINSSNFQLKNAAERMAINLPIQGLAADIMKLAMLEADKAVSSQSEFKEVKMILQIHDELIFEVKKEEAKVFAEKMKSRMEKVYDLKVPLLAEYSIGPNWSEV